MKESMLGTVIRSWSLFGQQLINVTVFLSWSNRFQMVKALRLYFEDDTHFLFIQRK
jgi:hypothetical protein